jgi:hypothetical protein
MRKIPPPIVTLVSLCLAGVFPLSRTIAQVTQEQKKHITIASEQITLDHLLRKLSKQSGLSLDVDPNDPLSGTPLTAYLTDVRIDDVASALVSLLSAKRATWRWEQLSDRPGTGQEVLPADFKPGIAYRLRPSPGAKVYAERTQSRILEDIAGLVMQTGADGTAPDSLPDLSTLTQALQKNRAEFAEFPRDRKPTQEEMDQFNLATNHRQAILSQLAQICLSRLLPGQRERLVQGKSVRIPVAAMDQDLAMGIHTAANVLYSGERRFLRGPDGALVEQSMIGPPTDELTIETRRPPFNIVLVLAVSVHRFASYGINNVVSGSGGSSTSLEEVGATEENRWRKTLTREWTPADVPSSSPLDDLPVPELNKQVSNSPPAQDAPLTASFSGPLTRLEEIVFKNNGKNLNILARLATFRGGASDPFSGEGSDHPKTVRDARTNLFAGRTMPTRWFNSDSSLDDAILLANALPGIWSLSPDKLVSPGIWAEYLAVRHANPHAYISFDALCDLSSRLSPDALETLFGTAEDDEDRVPPGKPLPVPVHLSDFVRQCYPLLAFLGRNPNLRRQAQSVDGINLNDEIDPELKEALQESIFTGTPGNENLVATDGEEKQRFGVLRVTIISGGNQGAEGKNQPTSGPAPTLLFKIELQRGKDTIGCAARQNGTD